MSKEKITKLMAIPMILGSMGNYMDDFLLFGNDKLLGYSVSLIGEIDELLEAGRSKEEIASLIQESDFSLKDPELTKEDSALLKKDALRTLEIRYQLFLEEKGTVPKTGANHPYVKNRKQISDPKKNTNDR